MTHGPEEMDAGTVEDLGLSAQKSYAPNILEESAEDVPFNVGETERDEDSEHSRSVDDTSHKNRSKRESRRMRELEQAEFSLELLKVRTTSVGAPLHEVPVTDSSTCDVDAQRHPPLQSPASHDSFELLTIEDMETGSYGGSGAPQEHPSEIHEGLRDSNHNEKPGMQLPNKTEGPLATFYIASDQSPVHEPKFESPSQPYERRESTSRRPVVVLISMQKESPVEEEGLASQTLEKSQSGASPTSSQMTSILGLEIGAEHSDGTATRSERDVVEECMSSNGQFSSTQASSPEAAGLCSSEVDIQIILQPKSNASSAPPSQQERKTVQEAPSPVLDTKPPKAQKKSSAQTVIVNMMEKSSNTVFSTPRRKLPFSK